MNQVGIVTDSTASFSPEIMDEYGISIVPMGYVLKNKVYRDYVDINPDEFWKIFPAMKEIPTTSACSIGDFRDAFSKLAGETKSIVCITISRVLSATFNAAEQAAGMVMQENPGVQIKVIDSVTSSGALAWIALEAARASKAGKELEEVVQVVEDMKSRVRYFIVMESLKYIMKVGRAPDSKNGNPDAAEVPKISPIMGIVKSGTGVMENLEKAADIDEALSKAVDMVGNYIDVSKPVHFMLHYPDRIDKCNRLKEELCNKYNCAETQIFQWAPTIMIATGPMYGLAFYT